MLGVSQENSYSSMNNVLALFKYLFIVFFIQLELEHIAPHINNYI